MWATAIELGIPALLVFALWRIWPRESADQPNDNPDADTPHHDHEPR